MIKKYMVIILLVAVRLQASEDNPTLQQIQANISRRQSREQQIEDQPFIRIVTTAIADKYALQQQLEELKLNCSSELHITRDIHKQIKNVEQRVQPLFGNTIESRLCAYQQCHCHESRSRLLQETADTQKILSESCLLLTSLRIELSLILATGINSLRDKIWIPKYSKLSW